MRIAKTKQTRKRGVGSATRRRNRRNTRRSTPPFSPLLAMLGGQTEEEQTRAQDALNAALASGEIAAANASSGNQKPNDRPIEELMQELQESTNQQTSQEETEEETQETVQKEEAEEEETKEEDEDDEPEEKPMTQRQIQQQAAANSEKVFEKISDYKYDANGESGIVKALRENDIEKAKHLFFKYDDIITKMNEYKTKNKDKQEYVKNQIRKYYKVSGKEQKIQFITNLRENLHNLYNIVDTDNTPLAIVQSILNFSYSSKFTVDFLKVFDEYLHIHNGYDMVKTRINEMLYNIIRDIENPREDIESNSSYTINLGNSYNLFERNNDDTGYKYIQLTAIPDNSEKIKILQNELGTMLWVKLLILNQSKVRGESGFTYTKPEVSFEGGAFDEDDF